MAHWLKTCRSLLRCSGSIRCSIRSATIRASKSSPPRPRRNRGQLLSITKREIPETRQEQCSCRLPARGPSAFAIARGSSRKRPSGPFSGVRFTGASRSCHHSPPRSSSARPAPPLRGLEDDQPLYLLPSQGASRRLRKTASHWRHPSEQVLVSTACSCPTRDLSALVAIWPMSSHPKRDRQGDRAISSKRSSRLTRRRPSSSRPRRIWRLSTFTAGQSLPTANRFSERDGSDPDLRKAIELLDEAVKRDPSFFDAYCQLAGRTNCFMQ